MNQGRCVFCGDPINPDRDYRKVTGWERHRVAGGTNAIRLREPQEQWACFRCVDKQAAGVSLQQGEFAL